MDYTKDQFSKKLLAFFDRHDPEKKAAVPEIVARFHGHEETVFDHLAERYAAIEGTHSKKVSGGGGFSPSVPGNANSGDVPGS